MEYVCETQRILLRRFQDSDLESILKVIGDPEVMRFSVHGPENAEGATKFLAKCQDRYHKDGVGQWAVVLKRTGVCVGYCGITVQHVDDQREHEIGYRILRALWGNGPASEAATACRDYGLIA